jgi:hypothetical protein
VVQAAFPTFSNFVIFATNVMMQITSPNLSKLIPFGRDYHPVRRVGEQGHY